MNLSREKSGTIEMVSPGVSQACRGFGDEVSQGRVGTRDSGGFRDLASQERVGFRDQVSQESAGAKAREKSGGRNENFQKCFNDVFNAQVTREAVKDKEEVTQKGSLGRNGLERRHTNGNSKVGEKLNENLGSLINEIEFVRASGMENIQWAQVKWGCKWDIEAMRQMMGQEGDLEVCDLLEYGFPLDIDEEGYEPQITMENHGSAKKFPSKIAEYLKKETEKGRMIGPFYKNPFDCKIAISPLSTREKKCSSDRRIISDMSWPPGNSVNDRLSKDWYRGERVDLIYPTVDDLARKIYEIGPAAMMFKTDLKSCFRQYFVCPKDIRFLGLQWEGKIYFDLVFCMGLRIAPYLAQRVSNCLKDIMGRNAYTLFNYIDDLLGVEDAEVVWSAYNFMMNMLRDLRVETADEKTVQPSHKIEFLGNWFNSRSQTISITDERKKELIELVGDWILREKCRRVEVESLIGKLQFVTNCVRSGRLFITRLLEFLRGMERSKEYEVPNWAKDDLKWWAMFLPQFSGTAIVWLVEEPTPDVVIATDACLKGCGGWSGTEFWRMRFPKWVREEWANDNIAHLELMAIIVAAKVWAEKLRGKIVHIHCDNQAVAQLINSGKGRNKKLLLGLRELVYCAARGEFEIKGKFIPGVSNRIPDLLSRWHVKGTFRREFRVVQKEKGLRRIFVPLEIMNFQHNW